MLHYGASQIEGALGYFDEDGCRVEPIDNPFQILLPSLLLAAWWDPIRGDPRFDEMLELVDSKVTHTEQYLRDQDISQKGE